MIIQINFKKAKYSSVGLEDDMFIYSTPNFWVELDIIYSL